MAKDVNVKEFTETADFEWKIKTTKWLSTKQRQMRQFKHIYYTLKTCV